MMQSPLNASASTAGNLLSSFSFEIPPFQREYSWRDDEIKDFWYDLSTNLQSQSYFLGLIILTHEDKPDSKNNNINNSRKQVVDGQQRLLTLTLLAKALQHESALRGRQALADKIQMDFLTAIDYETDQANPRMMLTDSRDNTTLQHILDKGTLPESQNLNDVSINIINSYRFLHHSLKEDLAKDPFKRLGLWAEFLKERLYFAVFLHRSAASAYTVFEVVNTRGRELTTADLLKNYILSQTHQSQRDDIYRRWRNLATRFSAEGANNNFVQYIRHVITTKHGYVPPKDLYSLVAQRNSTNSRSAPLPLQLVVDLEEKLQLYLQMIDPTLPGPATNEQLNVFRALNALNVMTVRPILMAATIGEQVDEVFDYILRIVVRRIVVGNLGTGNVERKFGEAAKKLFESHKLSEVSKEISDLDPIKDDFFEQLRKRSYNKNTLAFLRRSVLQNTTTPEQSDTLHFVWPRGMNWCGISDESTTWGTTIGNTVLSKLNQRPPKAADDWKAFKISMLTSLSEGEFKEDFEKTDSWDLSAIEKFGRIVAAKGVEIWY